MPATTEPLWRGLVDDAAMEEDTKEDPRFSATAEELEAQGKVRFPVEVSLSDESGEEVAAMRVEWHVSKGR